jgi:hypothetical protein
MIYALTFERALSTPNCLVLMATNYFGFFNSCFIHAIESNNCKRIDVFDHSLTFIKSISTKKYYPIDIDVYNDIMFVSTSSNSILVYQNETYLSNITTFCSSIKASIIDQTGNIFVLCSSDIIHFYSFNGSYLGVNWTSIVPSIILH